MNSVMARHKAMQPRLDPLEFEEEVEAWDWARAAGVSAQDLRAALRESLAADGPVLLDVVVADPGLFRL